MSTKTINTRGKFTMTKTNSSTQKRTFTHLTETERGEISAYRNTGLSLRDIAKKIGRNASTISRELKRGSVQQIDTYRKPFIKYFPETGARIYKENREHCGAHSTIMKAWEFLHFAEEKILEDKWSPDSVVGRAKILSEFKEAYIPSTKSIYNWIEQGKMSVINMDLAMKMRRSTKKKRPKKNNRILGVSIEERPESIDTREEFGHWEIDSVIGKKSNDDALLTLIERKTRKEIVRRMPAKDASSVEDALQAILTKYQKEGNTVFKSITADNGSEFSELADLGKQKEFDVYFAHPYASWERGTNERHNGLIRRFIKKGQPIHTYTNDRISEVENWLNVLPRKILDYQTPDEAFAQFVSFVA